MNLVKQKPKQKLKQNLNQNLKQNLRHEANSRRNLPLRKNSLRVRKLWLQKIVMNSQLLFLKLKRTLRKIRHNRHRKQRLLRRNKLVVRNHPLQKMITNDQSLLLRILETINNSLYRPFNKQLNKAIKTTTKHVVMKNCQINLQIL